MKIADLGTSNYRYMYIILHKYTVMSNMVCNLIQFIIHIL